MKKIEKMDRCGAFVVGIFSTAQTPRSNKVILIGSASREAIGRQARLAGNGRLAKRRNTADDRFMACLKGATQMILLDHQHRNEALLPFVQ